MLMLRIIQLSLLNHANTEDIGVSESNGTININKSNQNIVKLEKMYILVQNIQVLKIQ